MPRTPYFEGVCGIFIDVDLDDLGLGAKRQGNFLKRRSDHLAGPAPFRPEIDNHGHPDLRTSASKEASDTFWVATIDSPLFLELPVKVGIAGGPVKGAKRQYLGFPGTFGPENH